MNQSLDQTLAAIEPRLRQALVAAYGPEVGVEACADAIAWAWANADRLDSVNNTAGYLFRVGQSAARRYHRPSGYLPAPDRGRIPEVEPGLAPALEELSEQQRIVVVAVHCFQWSQQEVADLLAISHSSVRTHLARALEKLRTSLEVTHAD